MPTPRQTPAAERRVLIPLDVSTPPVPRPGGVLHRLGGETMGTTWTVTVVVAEAVSHAVSHAPSDALAALDAGIRAVLDGVVGEMSNWSHDADIGRFNRAAAASWVTLPADCMTVLVAARQVAGESGGAYDPTAGPLVDLWGFGPAPRRASPPAPDQVHAARARCGWALLELDTTAGRAWQPGGLSLDLCAIAKGFAVDAVSEWLASQHMPDHLVEIGGELRGHGVKPDGLPWWVEVEAPCADDAAPAAREAGTVAQDLVALHGLSVATSGDYRRYFEADGRRFAHTLDPRTGYPATHALASVTVIHPRCMLADAYSTALTVLGLHAGLDFARRHALAARFLVRTPTGFQETLSPAYTALFA